MPTRNHKKSASNFGKRNGGKRVQSCKAVSTGLDSHSSVYNLRSHARSPLDSSEPSKTKAAPIPKKTETSIAWTKKTNLDSPRYLAPPPEAYCIYSKTAALIDSLNVDDPGHQSRVVNYIKSTSIDPYDKKFILEYVRDPRSYVVNPTDSVDRQRHKLDLRDYTVFEITKGAECSINLWVTTAIATDPKYFFRWDGPDTREQLGPIRFLNPKFTRGRINPSPIRSRLNARTMHILVMSTTPSSTQVNLQSGLFLLTTHIRTVTSNPDLFKNQTMN
ncbi:hypothetical protein Pst134EA_015860 [Puccinia striiformis f. sp. tritici]|uniref:hypothetical protein n=1 Tax=Puccinia striiformis f. sp. tritici TaxID=168172 RepID=UPI002008228F|nr:hypothetical protein Pst134EA_015860 [Puccinia striiformis f. sp. tritici]KAH9453016.1 hypothetical protein Pst134EB_016954 [Puccinia striiformis f. sp. tritici]KAH9463777.1 hypothetical protein Pst134EA_015860 [Puccinia striiformis f. sp. tritici]